MQNGDNFDANLHQFLESWRRSLYAKWIRTERRELSHLDAENLVYNQRRIDSVRRTYKKGDAYVRAVLTAGAVSDAFYDVMLHQELENFCNHCRTEVVPTWHHVCWECEAFADGRPNVPADPLQLCLGWNVSSQTDWQVIDPCTWKQALASVCDQCPPPDLETDPDTQWVTFNAIAVHAHEQAF